MLLRRCKIHEGAVDAKAEKMMLCVMMLPLGRQWLHQSSLSVSA